MVSGWQVYSLSDENSSCKRADWVYIYSCRRGNLENSINRNRWNDVAGSIVPSIYTQ